MDPFSAEGELVKIHTAFIQGQYQSVLSDYDPSAFSPENKLPIQILQHRAQCALGQYDQVLESIPESDAKATPDLAAMRTYASFHKNPSAESKSVEAAEQLAESAGDNLSVEILCGTILARAGKQDQALQLLSRHQGSLDAVALIIQIHLAQNRTDLALKEAKAARSFAQDALLVNLAESWIGVRQGGENYQKAFYVFEELAQAPSSASATSLIQQAVSELHMGRVEEAETALEQALALEPENAQAVANKLVLDTILGKEGSELMGKLSQVDAEHEMLVDKKAKREAFQTAMAKYTPKFEP
ncbi:Coatomer subunit epsilon-1 [Lecanosticta acicola]|uniref:Coatomer subunit epsilon n=1 Tax=Lecanosticta acicola TaxID=111012 RepID=A0AAI8Z2D9_9PEZI|nr:Coatomer subunit epsilon-1 [Lecanosticta acicola]